MSELPPIQRLGKDCKVPTAVYGVRASRLARLRRLGLPVPLAYAVSVNAVRGFRSVSPQLLELMHVLSASKFETFRRVRVYAAMPYIFSALKISVTMCVLGAIVAEWIGSNSGIGYLLLQSMYDFNTPRLFAAIITASVVAIAAFAIVSWAETVIIRWNPGESF